MSDPREKARKLIQQGIDQAQDNLHRAKYRLSAFEQMGIDPNEVYAEGNKSLAELVRLYERERAECEAALLAIR